MVNSVGSKLNQWLRLCLASNIFAKGFFFLFNGVFCKHSLGLFWGVLLQKIVFFPNKTKKKRNKNYKKI
jgi:hypothetical protein